MKKSWKTAALFLGCVVLLTGCNGGAASTETESKTEEAMTETEKTEPVTETETEEETLPETTEAPAYPEIENGMYTMKSLDGWAKFHNRFYFLKDGSMTADWSASGFTMNVDNTGDKFLIHYKSLDQVWLSVWIDGEEHFRPCIEAGEGTVAVEMEPGIHTVSAFRETEISPTGKTFNLKGITFEGTILERPADSDLFIEYIGDSISCGDGSLGTYKSGEVWVRADHSATHGFPFYLSRMLGADFSIVAKGGIGLLNPSGDYAMGELYPYVTGYRDHIVEYDFKRIPDLVILELGANDGGYEEYQFYDKLKEFIAQIRKVYGPDVPIVWFGSSERFYGTMVRYMANVKNEDTNLYAFRFEYGRTGSAALATQTSGHPNAAEQLETAEKIFEFLKMNELIPTGE